MKYLVVGLGNIGAEYELTRHNVGFLILDRLADNEKVEFARDRHADVVTVKFKGRQLVLVKPTTFMNLSGKAVSYWQQELKIPRENLLIVVDELALPFGQLRLRARGSAAGHNGLKNIESLLGQDYARLRVGIGNDYPKGQQADYVLSNFTRQELDQLPPIMDRAIEVIFSFATQGIDRTMSQFNG